MLSFFQPAIFHFAKSRIMTFYYAVAKGRIPGIYETWDECKEQVHKFSGPVFKKFPSLRLAQDFVDSHKQSPGRSLAKSPQFVHTKAPIIGNLMALGRKGKTGYTAKENDKQKKDNVSSAPRGIKRKPIVESHDDPAIRSKRMKDAVYDMEPDGYVNVYTDGACTENGHKGAKAGVGVYFGVNSPLNVSEPLIGRATNNHAEIQAITRAAEVAKSAGITNLRLHTDSIFVINCATKWMPGWKRRGWVTASGKSVINKDELLKMEAALRGLAIKWNHVRGHQGVWGNEMADKLAREGATQYT